jgi:hypothetical protein
LRCDVIASGALTSGALIISGALIGVGMGESKENIDSPAMRPI